MRYAAAVCACCFSFCNRSTFTTPTYFTAELPSSFGPIFPPNYPRVNRDNTVPPVAGMVAKGNGFTCALLYPEDGRVVCCEYPTLHPVALLGSTHTHFLLSVAIIIMTCRG